MNTRNAQSIITSRSGHCIQSVKMIFISSHLGRCTPKICFVLAMSLKLHHLLAFAVFFSLMPLLFVNFSLRDSCQGSMRCQPDCWQFTISRGHTMGTCGKPMSSSSCLLSSYRLVSLLASSQIHSGYSESSFSSGSLPLFLMLRPGTVFEVASAHAQGVTLTCATGAFVKAARRASLCPTNWRLRRKQELTVLNIAYHLSDIVLPAPCLLLCLCRNYWPCLHPYKSIASPLE